MVRGKRCRSEEEESSQQYPLPADPIRQRSGKKCECGSGERIARNDNSCVTRRGLEFPGNGRQQKGNELSVRHPKEKNAEKDECDLPLERFTFGAVGHARILTQTIRRKWGCPNAGQTRKTSRTNPSRGGRGGQLISIIAWHSRHVVVIHNVAPGTNARLCLLIVWALVHLASNFDKQSP